MDQRIRYLLSDSTDKKMLSSLEEAFRKHRFTSKTPRGFILESVRGDSIAGRFIERVETMRTLIDPFGETLRLPNISYETTNFRLSTDAPQIEVTNAPRSLKKFLLFMGELTQFRLTVSEPRLDILKWIETISKRVKLVALTSLDCGNVQVTGSTAATVTFYGKEELQKDIRQFLGSRSYSLDRATVEIQHGLQEITCTLDSAARFKLCPEVDESLRGIIRQAVAVQVK